MHQSKVVGAVEPADAPVKTMCRLQDVRPELPHGLSDVVVVMTSPLQKLAEQDPPSRGSIQLSRRQLTQPTEAATTQQEPRVEGLAQPQPGCRDVDDSVGLLQKGAPR